MTWYIFLCLLHFSLSSGEYQESNVVYGLQELTRDILEKIKAATGQPIDTHRFYPLLAASSKGYETIEYQPYTKSEKYTKATSNKKLDGGHYHLSKGDKSSGVEKEHHFEKGNSGKDGEELDKQKYGDHWGKQHKYHEGRFIHKNHHKSDGGKKGSKSKKGRKHRKHHVEKGFRDIYHKDEETKSDFYWNNHHEEGKWIEYGFKNQKKAKSNDKGDEGKNEKTKKEESTYEKKEDKCTKCKTR